MEGGGSVPALPGPVVLVLGLLEPFAGSANDLVGSANGIRGISRGTGAGQQVGASPFRCGRCS
eukprot:1011690-Prorocentrum_minimum.AAC.2